MIVDEDRDWHVLAATPQRFINRQARLKMTKSILGRKINLRSLSPLVSHYLQFNFAGFSAIAFWHRVKKKITSCSCLTSISLFSANNFSFRLFLDFLQHFSFLENIRRINKCLWLNGKLFRINSKPLVSPSPHRRDLLTNWSHDGIVVVS